MVHVIRGSMTLNICFIIHNFNIFQTLLFLHEGDAGRSGTLAGEKKKVYVGMKILKKCTGAKLTSFKVI